MAQKLGEKNQDAQTYTHTHQEVSYLVTINVEKLVNKITAFIMFIKLCVISHHKLYCDKSDIK